MHNTVVVPGQTWWIVSFSSTQLSVMKTLGPFPGGARKNTSSGMDDFNWEMAVTNVSVVSSLVIMMLMAGQCSTNTVNHSQKYT